MPVLDDLLEKIDQKEFVRLSSDIRTVFHQHQRWFNSLNLALITPEADITEDDYCCCSHSHCKFGQWIKKILDNPKFHHPFFFDLDHQHKDFHLIANQLLTNRQLHQPIDLTLYNKLIEAQENFVLDVLTLFEFSIVTTNQFDTVTGLMNRRSVNSVLAYEKSRMVRHKTSQCCVAMVDIDHFKRINDVFGHDMGDSALAQVAAVLSSFTRKSDTIARYGGEEFLFVLPDISLQEAIISIERVRQVLAATPFELEQQTVQITASFGITQLTSDYDINLSLKCADEALYLAKRRGRNCTAYIDMDDFSATHQAELSDGANLSLNATLCHDSTGVNSEL